MAEQPQSPSQSEAAAGQPSNPGGPGDTSQATGTNPVEAAKAEQEDLTKEAANVPQMAATAGPDLANQDQIDHEKERYEAGEHAFALQNAKDINNENRLLDRQARVDGKEAMDVLRGTNAKLREDAAAGLKAHEMAQARAKEWTDPMPVEGRMTDVKIILHPEDPAQRVASIHIRVLGEVDDGYITVYRDGSDAKEVKQGRIAESPRFGTKNKVVAKSINAKTGLAEGEITHPGYFDWPPLRLNPGNYTIKVVTTAGKEVAKGAFKITGISPDDLSEKNSAGVTQAQRGAIQSAQGARAADRQTALKEGTKLPDPLSEEDVLGDLVGSAGKKK
jgi:hypothetical protein